MELTVGQTAPDFSAEASMGQTISLSDLRGKWVILYFYPRNNTPGCTREACEFRDQHGILAGLNAVVVGCSPDKLRSHDKFITKYNLPFILLSDPDHSIAAKYGVWKEKNMYGLKLMGIDRSTFLINPGGEIARLWRRVRVNGHIDEVIDELKLAVH